MKKKKRQRNPAKDSEWKTFARAVFSIVHEPQVILRYIKNRLSAKVNAWEDVGVSDKLFIEHFNLKRKVFYIEDTKTGNVTEVPFTKEQEKLFRKAGVFK